MTQCQWYSHSREGATDVCTVKKRPLACRDNRVMDVGSFHCQTLSLQTQGWHYHQQTGETVQLSYCSTNREWYYCNIPYSWKGRKAVEERTIIFARGCDGKQSLIYRYGWHWQLVLCHRYTLAKTNPYHFSLSSFLQVKHAFEHSI